MNLNEMPTAAAEARYVDTAAAAKMLRPQLKRAFPGVKFSVRIDRYAGGSSIDIGWTDGPLEADVRKVSDGFQGARFDGMIDLAYSADSWHCAEHGARAAQTYGHGDGTDGPCASRCCAAAELVHFTSGYVNPSRDLSPAFRADLEAAVAARFGRSYDDSVMVDGEWMGTHLHRLERGTRR